MFVSEQWLWLWQAVDNLSSWLGYDTPQSLKRRESTHTHIHRHTHTQFPSVKHNLVQPQGRKQGRPGSCSRSNPWSRVKTVYKISCISGTKNLRLGPMAHTRPERVGCRVCVCGRWKCVRRGQAFLGVWKCYIILAIYIYRLPFHYIIVSLSLYLSLLVHSPPPHH